ncbi:hypothetical protein IQ07DRAFT_315804 [Pyrenochaeta sp. DS3sAY3a]|nr:hypothetical protein IQ07DRAFT_315804 [Pyrenochaeta sp. DS3sAY3a]
MVRLFKKMFLRSISCSARPCERRGFPLGATARVSGRTWCRRRCRNRCTTTHSVQRGSAIKGRMAVARDKCCQNRLAKGYLSIASWAWSWSCWRLESGASASMKQSWRERQHERRQPMVCRCS